MNTNIRLSLPVHGAVEFITGLVMMLAPAALGVGAGGLVVSAALGAVLTGTALSLNTTGQGQSLAWHVHFDSIFLIASALSALGFALAGEARAAVFLAAIVVVQASLTLTTRYTTRT